MSATPQPLLQSNCSALGTTQTLEPTLHSITDFSVKPQSPQNWLGVALHYFRLTGSPILFIGKWKKGKQPLGTWEQFQQGQSEEDLIAYYGSIDKRQISGIGMIHLVTGCLDFDHIPPQQFPKIEAVLNEAIAAGLLDKAWIEVYQRNPDNDLYSIHCWYTPQEGSRYSAVKKLDLTDGGEIEIRIGGGAQTLLPPSEHIPSGTLYHFITGAIPLHTAPSLTDDEIDAIIAAVGIIKKAPRPVVTTLPTGNETSPYRYLSDKAYETIISELHAAIVGRGDDPRKLRCPNPSHEDKNHSAYVMTREGNTKRGEIYCEGCKALVKLTDACQAYGVDYAGIQKRYPTGTQTRGSIVGDSNPAPMPALPKVETKADPSIEIIPLPDGKRIVGNTQFVSDLIPFEDLPQVMLLKSAKKTGKTHAVNGIRKAVNSERNLFIAHRNTIIRDIAENRLEGEWVTHLDSQSDPDIFLPDVPNLVITPDSLRKLVDPETGSVPYYDCIFFDESEQGGKHLLGGTFQGIESQETFGIMRAIFAKGGHTIFMDANAGEVTDHLINSFDYLDKLEIINNYQPDKGKGYTIYPDETMLEVRVLEVLASGGKCYIPTDTLTQTRKLGQWLIEKGYTPLIIHRDTSQTADIQKALVNINKALDEHRVLVCSPSIVSGVNITTHVDLIAAFYTDGRILTSQEISQQVGRARNADKLEIYIPGDKPPDNPFTELPTADDLYQKEIERYNTQYKTMLTYDFDDLGEPIPFPGLAPSTARHMRLWAISTAKDMHLLATPKAALIRQLESEGYVTNHSQVSSDDTLKDIQIELRQIGSRLRSEDREYILSEECHLLSEEGYQQRFIKGTLTEKDALRVIKWKIEDTYRQPLATNPDLYDEWRKFGEGRALFRYLWLNQPDKALLAKDIDEIYTRDSFDFAQTSYHKIKNRLNVKTIYQYLFASIFEPSEQFRLTPEEAQKRTFQVDQLEKFWKDAHKKRDELKRYIGVDPTKYKRPTALLRAILATIGLKLVGERDNDKTIEVWDKDKRQKVSKQVPVYKYHIDGERVRVMNDQVKKRLENIENPPQIDGEYLLISTLEATKEHHKKAAKKSQDKTKPNAA